MPALSRREGPDLETKFMLRCITLWSKWSSLLEGKDFCYLPGNESALLLWQCKFPVLGLLRGKKTIFFVSFGLRFLFGLEQHCFPARDHRNSFSSAVWNLSCAEKTCSKHLLMFMQTPFHVMGQAATMTEDVMIPPCISVMSSPWGWAGCLVIRRGKEDKDIVTDSAKHHHNAHSVSSCLFPTPWWCKMKPGLLYE